MKRTIQAMILFNTCSRRWFCAGSRLATQVRQKNTLRKLYGVSNEELLRSNSALLPLLRRNSFKVTATAMHTPILLFPVRGMVTEPEGESAEELRKKREKTARRTKYALYGILATSLGLCVYALLEWGKPRTDEEGNVISDKFSNLPKVQQYLFRTLDTLHFYHEVLREPSRELLLPPPLEHPYVQPPYTLVIEMTGVLLHPEWTLSMGWRFKKRRFLEYFLQQCGPPLFELVIFTEEAGMTAFPLIDSMDPNGYIMHRLFRDSTRYDSLRLKDLNCLNRDLKRVIHVDWNRNACKLNPDNCLILKKWEGDSDDKSLYDLALFLRTIASHDVDDVREIIRHYNQQPDPLEAFRDYQRRMAEYEENKTQKAKEPSTLSSFRRK